MTETGGDGETEPMRWALDDPAFKAHPYPHYARLLATGRRIVRSVLPSGTPVCMTLGYSEALSLLRDDRFIKTSPEGAEAPGLHPLFVNLVASDPPDHTRLRAATQDALSRVGSPALRAMIATSVQEAMVALASEARQDPVDLVANYAVPLASKVVCRVVGLPANDAARIAAWSRALNAAEEDPAVDARAVASEIDGYLQRQCQEKRREGNDALSSLLGARDAGWLSDNEVRASAFLLMMAGFESSANFIASSVLRMLQRPDLWVRLASRDVRPGRAVDELLRIESPLEFATPRYAATEVCLNGFPIRKGEMVFAGLGSANRDPARFDRADEVDFDRDRSPRHLAFGFGRHACPGGTMGRMIAEVGLVSLATAFPSLSLACSTGELTWWPSLVMRGLHRLPVRLGPSPAAGEQGVHG